MPPSFLQISSFPTGFSPTLSGSSWKSHEVNQLPGFLAGWCNMFSFDTWMGDPWKTHTAGSAFEFTPSKGNGALLWPISRRKWWHPGLNFKHSGACRVEEWATCHALDLQLESTCPKHPVNCDLRWPIDYSFMLLLLLLLLLLFPRTWRNRAHTRSFYCT